MQSTHPRLDDVRVNLEFTKRPTSVRGSLGARGRPCTHMLTMRDGGWRTLTLIRARSVSLAHGRGLVGWLVGRSVGRPAHAYANHIRRRAGFQAEMSAGQFRRAIDYHSIPAPCTRCGANRAFDYPFQPPDDCVD